MYGISYTIIIIHYIYIIIHAHFFHYHIVGGQRTHFSTDDQKSQTYNNGFPTGIVSDNLIMIYSMKSMQRNVSVIWKRGYFIWWNEPIAKQLLSGMTQ